jgi:hypothetical protein
MLYNNNIHVREKNRIADKLSSATLPSGARMTILDQGGYDIQISLHGGPYGFPKYVFNSLTPNEGLKVPVTGYSLDKQPEATPEDYRAIMAVIGNMKPEREQNEMPSLPLHSLPRRSWGSLGSFFGRSSSSGSSSPGSSSPREFSGGRQRKTRTKRRYRRFTRKVRS